MSQVSILDQIPTVSPSQYQKYIKLVVKHRAPLLIIGGSGIGKTRIPLDLARKNGWEVMFIAVDTLTPYDLLGYPYIERKEIDGIKLHLLRPEDLLPNKNSDRPGIIILDEITRIIGGITSITNSLMRLIKEGRLPGWEIPDNFKGRIIATGNPPTDEYSGTTNLDMALIDRFSIRLKMESNQEDWINWAFQNKLHPLVISFISTYKNLLYNEEKFLTPRRWEIFSNIITEMSIPSDIRMVNNPQYIQSVKEIASITLNIEVASTIEQFILVATQINLKNFRKSPKQYADFLLQKPPQEYISIIASLASIIRESDIQTFLSFLDYSINNDSPNEGKELGVIIAMSIAKNKFGINQITNIAREMLLNNKLDPSFISKAQLLAYGG